jgi:ferric-dicitrate binding protein FerR (iron transport regulator)
LKPGQQAQVASNIKVISDADLEQVMAWKNGAFGFRNTNITQIMRQVARWYDVEVVYRGQFGQLNFGGSVSRQANLSELLKRLEATEAVKFSVEGKKVTVMAWQR